MNILIIGVGNMGRGIATRALAGGNSVTLYDEDSTKADAQSKELAGASGSRVTVSRNPAEAIKASDLVVLATPYAVSLTLARQLGATLAGKVVIDISNALDDTYTDLVTAPGTSAAEEIAKLLPASVKLVKAFNTTFAGTLVAGEVAGQPLDVFIAGDDEGAKKTVSDLVRSGGLNPIDVGGLNRARLIEALGLLGITLQSRLNTGFATGWKLLLPN
jgi:8-hydroxy-5-deazaflavin:NADPH oxidoreductase